MRILAIVLGALLILIQYPLWLGKGGWMRVWDLDRQAAERREQNQKLQARNQALDAEVRDLKHGTDAIEERARYELGMVKPNELFFQIIPEAPRAAEAKPPTEPR